MMSLGITEVLMSLVYAILYGAGYALAFAVVSCLAGQGERFRGFLPMLLEYDKILEKPIKNKGRTEYKPGNVFLFCAVIFFAIGFLLLSYFALDGCLRVYMLLASVTSFLLTKSLACDKIYFILDALFGFLFFVLVAILRLPISVLLRFARKIKEYIIDFIYKTRVILDKAKGK
jgi:hypothetical protein